METTRDVTEDVRAALGERFGHRDFRHGQERIVEAVMSGEDVLAVMPTGSGKSLCYQLPAVLLPGTTLVVSPLISLMKDQVDELTRRGIRSAALHSLLSAPARREVMAAHAATKLRARDAALLAIRAGIDAEFAVEV
jgi:ATP-dependent DNA helicase RecQ